MKKIALALLLVGGLGVMSAGMVQASAITTGPWYAFEFGFPGTTDAVGVSTHDSSNPGVPPWTYTAAAATSVKITDSYNTGDMFNLYDNGFLVGTTSTVDPTPFGTTNPTPALDYLDPTLVMVFLPCLRGPTRSPSKPTKSTPVLKIFLCPSVWPSSRSRLPFSPAPGCWVQACWG